MKVDELKAKRVREALGAIRELRHTTQAARKHVAAAIRMQRIPAARLRRKLSGLERMFENDERYSPPEYSLDEYVGELHSALDSEADRLAELEKEVLTIQKRIAKRVASALAKPKKEPTAKQRARGLELRKEYRDAQRQTADYLMSLARASGDPKLVARIRDSLAAMRDDLSTSIYILERLKADDLTPYAIEIKKWVQAAKAIRDLK